jgi:hypothetical protein
MPLQELYAYVDGADLESVANILVARFSELVGSRHWICGRAWVVNQRHEQAADTQPDDLPLWELGLNLEIPDVGAEPNGWFSDIEAIAIFLGRLHRETGRDFVIGVADAGTGATHEDMFFVSSDEPDTKTLREVFRVNDAA